MNMTSRSFLLMISSLCLSIVSAAFAQETNPPAVVSTASLDGTRVGVLFNEDLDASSAENANNYAINGTSIWSAELQPDGRAVVLETSGIFVDSYTLTVSGVQDLAGNEANVSVSGMVLELESEDIGFPSTAGSAFALAHDNIRVAGGGNDIWFTWDEFHYTHQQRSGDFDVKVRVAGFGPEGAHANAKAALMVREDLTGGSRHSTVTVYPYDRNWTAFRRLEASHETGVASGDWRIFWSDGTEFPNVWMRLRRTGDTLFLYGGPNGTDWVQIGDAYTSDYPDSVYVGMATAAFTEGAGPIVDVWYEDFGDFELPDATIEIEQDLEDITIPVNSTATFAIDVSVTGASPDNLIYQWQKDGIDIPVAIGPSYTISSVKQEDDGSRYQVIVRFPGGQSVTSSSSLLTVSDDTNPPQVVSTASLNGEFIGVCFDELLDSVTADNPSNYGLNQGTVTSAELQPNGTSVQLTVTGLSGSSYALAVSGVTDLSNNSVDAMVEGQISDLTVVDINSAVLEASVFSCSADSVLSTVQGGDIWNAADALQFVYREYSGDFDVTVRVESFGPEGAHADSKSALMARETVDADSRHISITTYPAQRNWTAFFRGATGGASGVLAGEWRIEWPTGIDYPNVWMRMQRDGDSFTTFGSSDGEQWIQIGDTYIPDVPYPETILVGMGTEGQAYEGFPAVEVVYSGFGVLESAVPGATIRSVDGDIVISWPAEATEFVLYSSADLENWTEVTATVEVVDGENVVTLPLEGNRRFFRLQK